MSGGRITREPGALDEYVPLAGIDLDGFDARTLDTTVRNGGEQDRLPVIHNRRPPVQVLADRQGGELPRCSAFGWNLPQAVVAGKGDAPVGAPRAPASVEGVGCQGRDPQVPQRYFVHAEVG